jgi:hypothetical protein
MPTQDQRFLLTRRTDLRFGPVDFAPNYDSRGRRSGVPFTLLTQVALGAMAAPDDDLLIDDATGASELPNEAETVTWSASQRGTGPLDNADTPASIVLKDVDGNLVTVIPLGIELADGRYQERALTTVVTHSSSVVALTVVHAGYDRWGQKVVETHAISAGTTSKTVAGKKAMAFWEQTAITAAADASANTLKLGTNDVLGLHYRAASKADVVRVFFNGAIDDSATVVAAVDTTPSATTGDVRGTVDPSSACDGSEVVVWLAVDPTSKATAYGVDQYAG